MSYPTVTPIDDRRLSLFERVYRERQRQERLKAEGRFRYTCADNEMPTYQKYAVLGEEFGEVGRAILQADETESTEVHKGVHVAEELIQVMAVALAWLEALTAEAQR